VDANGKRLFVAFLHCFFLNYAGGNYGNAEKFLPRNAEKSGIRGGQQSLRTKEALPKKNIDRSLVKFELLITGA
jgi:hypothetical protein